MANDLLKNRWLIKMMLADHCPKLYERAKETVEYLATNQEMYSMIFDEECLTMVEWIRDLNRVSTKLLCHWLVSLLMHSMANR